MFEPETSYGTFTVDSDNSEIVTVFPENESLILVSGLYISHSKDAIAILLVTVPSKSSTILERKQFQGINTIITSLPDSVLIPKNMGLDLQVKDKSSSKVDVEYRCVANRIIN